MMDFEATYHSINNGFCAFEECDERPTFVGQIPIYYDDKTERQPGSGSEYCL
jgi:hypothetical protein